MTTYSLKCSSYPIWRSKHRRHSVRSVARPFLWRMLAPKYEDSLSKVSRFGRNLLCLSQRVICHNSTHNLSCISAVEQSLGALCQNGWVFPRVAQRDTHPTEIASDLLSMIGQLLSRSMSKELFP